MNVLLFSMPDSFEHTAPVAIRIPNAAIASLAGNVDPHHRVAVADLVLAQGHVAETVDRLVREHEPDLVGLSVMTFQRRTAVRLVERLRRLRPSAGIVVGGYDPSLATDAWTGEPPGVDFIARGEGEETLSELLRGLEGNGSLEHIAGLSYRVRSGFHHNPPRETRRLEDDTLRRPNRSARVLSGYTFLGRPIDVVETSRGCTFDCSFCSIIAMRGRNFHRRGFERVLADIRDAREHGARSIFIVDDNITLDVKRFEALCDAIVEAGLDDVEYLVQAMTSSIADHGDSLAPKMRRAGFRYVFLGIENVLVEDLAFLKAEAKNRRHEGGRSAGNATLQAIEHLHRHDMIVVGGLIVVNPGDTRESIEANLEFARRHVDWPYIQHPTPVPGDANDGGPAEARPRSPSACRPSRAGDVDRVEPERLPADLLPRRPPDRVRVRKERVPEHLGERRRRQESRSADVVRSPHGIAALVSRRPPDRLRLTGVRELRHLRDRRRGPGSRAA